MLMRGLLLALSQRERWLARLLHVHCATGLFCQEKFRTILVAASASVLSSVHLVCDVHSPECCGLNSHAELRDVLEKYEEYGKHHKH